MKAICIPGRSRETLIGFGMALQGLSPLIPTASFLVLLSYYIE
jgi:hypothetical protein